jgi:hypothetical protein
MSIAPENVQIKIESGEKEYIFFLKKQLKDKIEIDISRTIYSNKGKSSNKLSSKYIMSNVRNVCSK